MSMMQNFWQRTQNYMQNLLMRYFMTYVIAQQDDFYKATGQSWAAYRAGVSTSSAVIAIVDWAFEVPHPMPPRVHVSHMDVMQST